MVDIPAVRKALLQALHMVLGSENKWRTVSLILLACNIKNLPLVWHYRFFSAALQHTLRPRSIPKPLHPGSYALFLPVITSSRSPLLECDYNIHKSNSTYFSDLDVTRTHLLSLLCAPGLPAYRKRRASGEETAPFNIALGGVACFFQREIKPYEPYEMWTRILGWDHKWVYVVTHFVRKGVKKPAGYLMHEECRPWFSFLRGRKSEVRPSLKSESDQSLKPKSDIFAFGLSKCVFKSGRKTLAPELVFQRCQQLPLTPKPEKSPETSTPSSDDAGITENTMANSTTLSPGSVAELLEWSMTPEQEPVNEWTWDMIEAERERGMKIASLMAGLDQLKEEFTGDSKLALGEYRDLFWV
ncbi:hypothetical protein F5884DRAFT_770245 [Xylogone sp. PMI_703]|nr:hypothetical protein F5884DRAFT_770245 [Xylogone sp. PMI_703]